MTLHDAIYEVLNTHGKPMSYQEIADEIALRRLYTKKDKTRVLPGQISARVNNYPKLFIKEDSSVALKHWK